MTSIEKKEKQEFLFITCDIMIGDADSFCNGATIMSKSKWEDQLKEFINYLTSKDLKKDDQIRFETEAGFGYVGISNYEAKACPPEEIAILRKYFGDDDYFGQFRNLTDFISEKEEDDEDY